MKKGQCVLCGRKEASYWYKMKKGRICNPCYSKQIVSGKCDDCGTTQSRNWITKYGKTRCDLCYAKIKKPGECDFCGRKSSQSWFNDYEKRSCRNCHGTKRTTQLKIDAFKHYSNNGKIKCNWKGCHVSDIDMLNIDHTKNNGAEHRKQLRGNKRGNGGIYQELKNQKYENKDYQILCWNHNLKKEIMRVRGKTDSKMFNVVLLESQHQKTNE